MKLHDAELRDALRPLAGDPRADAERVMAALPAPHPGWWKPVLWVGLGAAAGWLVAWFGSPPSTEAPTRKSPVDVVEAPALPRARIVHGRVTAGSRSGNELARGDATIAYEEPILTKYGALELASPGGVLLRVGEESEVQLHGPREIGFIAGHLWLDVDPAAEPAQVWLGDDIGRIEIEDGTLCLQLDAEMLSLVVTRGAATLVNGDDSRRLQRGQCLEQRPGASDSIEDCEPTLASEWVALFLADPINAKERTFRLEELIRLLADPAYQQRADRQIRMLGGNACGGLLLALDLTGDPGQQRALALLFADLVAEHEYSMTCLQMLASQDADVRAAMFRALLRLLGTAPADADTEEFWRQAPPMLRQRAIDAWWGLLRRGK